MQRIQWRIRVAASGTLSRTETINTTLKAFRVDVFPEIIAVYQETSVAQSHTDCYRQKNLDDITKMNPCVYLPHWLLGDFLVLQIRYIPVD